MKEPPRIDSTEKAAELEGATTAHIWDFDQDEAVAIAPVFSSEVGEWSVMADDTAPSGQMVLAQQSSSSGSVFNVVIAQGTSYRDIDISVQLRSVEGRIDQGGGILWRARDARNYYIARFNPLEDNFRVYFVKDGSRRQLESATVHTDHAAWHALRVTMKGDHIEGYLDGTKYLDARDTTFPEPGMVGLWTKADAKTHFDDLTVRVPGTSALDARAIGEAAGTKAKVKVDGVVRVAWPRSDVSLTVDGMPFRPAAGLTSWAAFTGSAVRAMMMGDTVVFQDEVDAAMDAAFAGDLEITALHNHFFFDEPKVYFMHIGGGGDPVRLAEAVKGVWDAIRVVRASTPQPARHFAGTVPKAGTVDTANIERIVGHRAAVNDGVVKVSIGRDGTMNGVRVGGSMGLSTWAAFSGSCALAAVDGDFIMTAAEVQPVLRALRRAGIHVVALHNHMIGDEPAFYFTHFWGKGSAADLARGFRSALDAQSQVARTVGHR